MTARCRVKSSDLSVQWLDELKEGERHGFDEKSYFYKMENNFFAAFSANDTSVNDAEYWRDFSDGGTVDKRKICFDDCP